MLKKTERGDPLEFFNIHSVAKHQNIEGGPFGEKFSRKKSHNAVVSHNLWSRPVFVTRKTFLVQFLGPTGTIWGLLKIF